MLKNKKREITKSKPKRNQKFPTKILKRKKPSRGRLYSLNSNFEFFQELRSLILKASPAEKDQLTKRILDLGRIKLAIISGIFLNYGDNFVFNPVADLFIVADDINKRKLSSFLRSLEAEVGREIKFGLMEKEEFEYRYNMFDRFVRVLLEGPHEKIINKLGL